jgi:hypothetical protein
MRAQPARLEGPPAPLGPQVGEALWSPAEEPLALPEE